MRARNLIPFALLVLLAAPVWAHQSLGVGNLETSPENPIVVDDPDLSQVVYFEATEESHQVWLRFDASQGDPLYLQLGVPVIERYAALRPAMALLGPGMSPVSLPFETPDTDGGMVFTTEGETPGTFDEVFTGTELWQWDAEELSAPATGTYYLVGYLPDTGEGKFIVTVGVREEFGLADILDVPRVVFSVRAFHEVGPIGGLLLLVPMAIFAIALLGFLLFR